MLSKDIEMIIVKYKKYIDAFEEFDRTGKWPLEKTRRSFTIQQAAYQKLKAEAKKRKMSMSDLLDELIENA